MKDDSKAKFRRRQRKLRDDNDSKQILADSIFADELFSWDVVSAGHECKTIELVDTPKRPRRVVASDGRISIEELRDKTPIITNGIPIGASTEVRRYAPLKHHDLYLKFAALEKTEAALVNFANEFGMLGSNEVFFAREGDNRTVVCGRVIDWYASIDSMRDALALWHAAIDNNEDELSRLTFKEGQPPSPSRWLITFHSRFRRGITSLWLRPDCFDPKMIRQLESGDRALAAKIFVQRAINEGMNDQISPRLLWNPDRQQHLIRILPTSLIGAMWWQFARAVAGEVSYRTCRVCGRPILVSSRRDSSSKPFRSDRQFCSSACRQKDHRHRVQEAKRLMASGETVNMIAKKLETSSKVIRNWLRVDTQDDRT